MLHEAVHGHTCICTAQRDYFVVHIHKGVVLKGLIN